MRTGAQVTLMANGAKHLLVLVALLLLGALLPGARTTSGAPSAQGGVVLSPADDSFVRIRSPVANFDEHPQGISVTAVGFPEGLPEDFGYLRFNISAYGGTVADAQLELYNRIAPGPSVTVGLYAVESDDWNGAAEGLGDETTITFSNAPAEGALLDVQPGAAAPAWMVFQSAALTAHLAARVAGGSEWVTLRLRVMSNGMTNLNFFEDREDTGTTGNTPRLTLSGVTLLPPSPTPTATATPTIDPLAIASPTASPTATRTATSTPTPVPTRPAATATVSATPPPNPSASASPTGATPGATVSATGTVTITVSPTLATQATPDGTGTSTPDAETPTATAPITSTLATPDATGSPPPTAEPGPTTSPEATDHATPSTPTGTPHPLSTPPTATLESTPTSGPGADGTPSPVATAPGPLRRAYLPMLMRSTAGGR